MIIIDTNVVSALMRRDEWAETRLVSWLNDQADQDFRLTAVSLFELRFGVARLPAGRRKIGMHGDLEWALTELFRDRVLPFDDAAAEAMAVLQSQREASGRPSGYPDAQIAGIAIARGATVCTRNVRHFEDAGVPVVNPWA